ncbi:two pore domain potassium channel family protein [archaeon]|nr:MAG: two pore domain potassium channel family protein [archaeon]
MNVEAATMTTDSADKMPSSAPLMAKSASLRPRVGGAPSFSAAHAGRPSLLWQLLTFLSPAWTTILLLHLIGTPVYMIVEGMSAVNALYLCTGVMSSVGIVVIPTTFVGKSFTVLLNIISLGLGVLLLTEIAEARRKQSTAWVPARLARRIATADAFSLLLAALPSFLLSSWTFSLLEGWSMPDAAYFTFIVGTGLGMDNVEPRHASSRLFFIAYVWYQTGITLCVLGSVGQALYDRFVALLPPKPRGAWHSEALPATSWGDAQSGHAAGVSLSSTVPGAATATTAVPVNMAVAPAAAAQLSTGISSAVATGAPYYAQQTHFGLQAQDAFA